LKLYADIAGSDHRGTAEPWTYSEALASYRDLIWRNRPASIPDPDIRARYLAEQSEAEREAQRRHAAELEAATPGGALSW
jgi:hypothetical protein